MNFCECGKLFPEQCARDCIKAERDDLRKEMIAALEECYSLFILIAAVNHRPLEGDPLGDKIKALLKEWEYGKGILTIEGKVIGATSDRVKGRDYP